MEAVEYVLHVCMRAWQVRELGPGSYIDQELNDTTSNFFETGDFKFELNTEYRFNLFWYLKGAIFLDVGNVWSLGNDGRVGSGLTSFPDFFDELAVGTGFGLRLDVDYFVISSDFGYKLRNPYPNEEGKRWLFNDDGGFQLKKFRN